MTTTSRPNDAARKAAAEAAREAARQGNGEFGAQEHGLPHRGLSDDEIFEGITADQAMGWAHSAARDILRNPDRHTSVEHDDIVQEAMLRSLQTQRKVEEGELEIRNPHAVIYKNANHAIAESFREHTRWEDSTARRLALAKQNEMEQELRRSLDPLEIKAVQAQVIAEWSDRRHMPTADCFKPTKTFSIDPAEADTVVGRMDAIVSANIAERLRAEISISDNDADIIDEVAAMKRPDAKKAVWNQLASLDGNSGVPNVVTASVTRRNAAIARREVESFGGISAAIRAWDEGHDSPAIEAVFKPFGDINGAQREQVMETLARNPDRAKSLWVGALAASTKDR